MFPESRQDLSYFTPSTGPVTEKLLNGYLLDLAADIGTQCSILVLRCKCLARGACPRNDDDTNSLRNEHWCAPLAALTTTFGGSGKFAQLLF